VNCFDDDKFGGWLAITGHDPLDLFKNIWLRVRSGYGALLCYLDEDARMLRFQGMDLRVIREVEGDLHAYQLGLQVFDRKTLQLEVFDLWENLRAEHLVDAGILPGEKQDFIDWKKRVSPAEMVDPARIDQAPRNPDADSQNVPAGPPAPTVLAHGEMSQEVQEIFVLARQETWNGKKLMSVREFTQRTIQELLNRWVASPDRAKEFLQRDYYRLGVVHKRDGAMPKIFLGGLDVITVGDFCEKDALLNHEKIYFQMHPELRPK